MAKGKVRWFKKNLGFGFIIGPGQEDVFVHYSAIIGEGKRFLKRGQLVEFECSGTPRGLRATEVKVAE